MSRLRVIVGEDIPDFRRIAEFRRRHPQHMQLLFVRILSMCREAYIATVRLKHHEQVPDSAQGRPPKDLTTKEKMARKPRTKRGSAEYARRKAIVEPPFGQIKHCQGFRQFLLRGLEQMQGEWKLVCLTHNLLKVLHYGRLTAG